MLIAYHIDCSITNFISPIVLFASVCCAYRQTESTACLSNHSIFFSFNYIEGKQINDNKKRF